MIILRSFFLTFALPALTACFLLTGCQTFKSSWEAMKADVNPGHYKESRPMGRYIMD